MCGVVCGVPTKVPTVFGRERGLFEMPKGNHFGQAIVQTRPVSDKRVSQAESAVTFRFTRARVQAVVRSECLFIAIRLEL